MLERHWIITLVICFKLNLLGCNATTSTSASLSPWPFPAHFYWRDKMAFPGQNERGTERRDRTSRILSGYNALHIT